MKASSKIETSQIWETCSEMETCPEIEVCSEMEILRAIVTYTITKDSTESQQLQCFLNFQNWVIEISF